MGELSVRGKRRRGRRVLGARRRTARRRRAGVATIDYMLTLGVVLPLVAFIYWTGPKLMNLVYEMTCVLVSWPFL